MSREVDVLLVLPIALPLATAIASLWMWRRVRVQRVLALAGTSGLLAGGLALLDAVWHRGVLATQAGSWPAPFGITLVADLFSAAMVAVGGLVGLAVAVYSVALPDPPREAHGYYPLLHVLLMGVSGAFLTGDLFNLYVWFEVMLMASFVLLALGGERPQLEGALKYVTLNMLSSAIFLAAVGVVYGLTGTLNLADLSVRLAAGVAPPALVSTAAALLLAAFGIKAAVFPFFFWLPASYHTPPPVVSALFAGLLTKVGVYALVRVFTLVFVHDTAFTHTVILAAAAATMVTGVLGAAAQAEFRRVLSFHIVSQIGYMIMGLGLMTPLALAGTVFYVIHHIVVKTNLFLVAGVVRHLEGTGRLESLGGLYERRPMLALLFLVPALSLAGLPPLSGFWAKLLLVRAGLEAGAWLVTATALAVGLLTLFSMTKLWGEVFWKPSPAVPGAAPMGVAPRAGTTAPAGALAVIAGLALLTLAVGLAPAPLLELATRAAAQLLDPGAYTRAVLGGR